MQEGGKDGANRGSIKRTLEILWTRPLIGIFEKRKDGKVGTGGPGEKREPFLRGRIKITCRALVCRGSPESGGTNSSE